MIPTVLSIATFLKTCSEAHNFSISRPVLPCVIVMKTDHDHRTIRECSQSLSLSNIWCNVDAFKMISIIVNPNILASQKRVPDRLCNGSNHACRGLCFLKLSMPQFQHCSDSHARHLCSYLFLVKSQIYWPEQMICQWFSKQPSRNSNDRCPWYMFAISHSDSSMWKASWGRRSKHMRRCPRYVLLFTLLRFCSRVLIPWFHTCSLTSGRAEFPFIESLYLNPPLDLREGRESPVFPCALLHYSFTGSPIQ